MHKTASAQAPLASSGGARPSEHLLNLLGAFVTDQGDALTRELERAIGTGGSIPAALLSIETWPDRSIDFLANVVGLTHSATVRLVARLEAEGWVERGAGADGRVVALRLKRAGRKRVQAARNARRDQLAAFAEHFHPGALEEFERALTRFLRDPSRTRQEARHSCRFCDHTVCRGAACPIGSSVAEAMPNV